MSLIKESRVERVSTCRARTNTRAHARIHRNTRARARKRMFSLSLSHTLTLCHSLSLTLSPPTSHPRRPFLFRSEPSPLPPPFPARRRLHLTPHTFPCSPTPQEPLRKTGRSDAVPEQSRLTKRRVARTPCPVSTPQTEPGRAGPGRAGTWSMPSQSMTPATETSTSVQVSAAHSDTAAAPSPPLPPRARGRPR